MAFQMLSRHASCPIAKGCVVVAPARKTYSPGVCTSEKSKTCVISQRRCLFLHRPRQNHFATSLLDHRKLPRLQTAGHRRLRLARCVSGVAESDFPRRHIPSLDMVRLHFLQLQLSMYRMV